MTQAQVVAWIALLVVLPVLWILFRALVMQDAERMVEEFQRTFPGQCLICSYHRYGVMEGHVSGEGKDHNCVGHGENHRG